MTNRNNLLQKRLKNVQCVITDCDGVLTDGTLYISDEGEVLKGFHAHDGAAMSYLKKADIRVVLVSGRDSDALETRAKELQVDDFFPGVMNKGSVCEKIKEKYDLSRKQICYIGDDLTDLSAFEKAGITASVENGRDVVRRQADYVVNESGGSGAFRSLAEDILKAKGLWEQVVRQYGL